MKEKDHTIILFYNYVAIDDPEALKEEQVALCSDLGLTGRVIVSKEGINATLEGTSGNIKKYVSRFLSNPRFADTHMKYSEGDGNSFPRLSVKVRPEIVSLHLDDEDIDPKKSTGKRLSSDELHSWFEEGRDFEIIDMRNDYEHKVGHFKGSILPALKNFRDLKKTMPELLKYKDKTVLTVCTGGVRCEKASGYLKERGFKDVYQLDGGMVSYMEKYPNQNFLGQLYVFDGRITTGFDLDDPKRVVIGKCEKCERECESYVNCANLGCHYHFICCDGCREKDGEAYCGDACKERVTIGSETGHNRVNRTKNGS